MTTAIQITKEDNTIERLLFMTVQRPDGNVDVDLFLADEEFNPTGTPSLGVSEQSEIDYHIELRKQAKEKGQFIPDYSTNPELSPDYKPEEDETRSIPGDMSQQ